MVGAHEALAQPMEARAGLVTMAAGWTPQLRFSLANFNPGRAQGGPPLTRRGSGERRMRPRSGVDLGSVWAQRLRQLEQRLRVSPAAGGERRGRGRWGKSRATPTRDGGVEEGRGGAWGRGTCDGQRLGPPAPPLSVESLFLGLKFGRES